VGKRGSRGGYARRSFSEVGKGIILARFFDSFFIEWKNECPSGEDKAMRNH
jgi:hypothetical protein